MPDVSRNVASIGIVVDWIGVRQLNDQRPCCSDVGLKTNSFSKVKILSAAAIMPNI